MEFIINKLIYNKFFEKFHLVIGDFKIDILDNNDLRQEFFEPFFKIITKPAVNIPPEKTFIVNDFAKISATNVRTYNVALSSIVSQCQERLDKKVKNCEICQLQLIDYM